MNEELPIYELTISEADEGNFEVDYIALVDRPAIQRNFQAFSDEIEVMLAIQDKAQRIVSGALMIPDKLILRRDDKGEYFIKFTAETIKQIAIRFAKQGYQKNVNLQHDKDQRIEAVLFESWVKDSERGIGGMKGYEDLPDGTWFGSMKITDDAGWNKVEAGDHSTDFEIGNEYLCAILEDVFFRFHFSRSRIDGRSGTITPHAARFDLDRVEFRLRSSETLAALELLRADLSSRGLTCRLCHA